MLTDGAAVLYLRAAVPQDVITLARWRREAAEWAQRVHGFNQWSTPFDEEEALEWIAQGATVMAAFSPGGEPVATRSVLATGEPRLWTEEERAVPARYLAKFNVDRRFTGLGIGDRLTDWARRRAHRAGAEVVRINVWTENTRLQAYHRRYGWRHVRTVPDNVAGALFEMPVLADEFDPNVREVEQIGLP
ncbi:GNAT family N-acetyltransferase [Streptomyces gibsoniae]|uniref:GNAT family N-acetyltransferase n=1 Tax=Streptomyces gibsoniae TaxID=3075529 RepID=A0ABU2U7X6_9ACTN|nr:GNAT family N-acetyltransferase [Streptomyces sp. DSM 41699]MDT0469319.1 GNAT family N-acetyltransferase [Streptomyces sp. DSM 41699]